MICKSAESESKLKYNIKKMLIRRGVFYISVKGGAHTEKGSPDLVLCHRQRFIACEAKEGYNDQSDWQNARQEEAQASGAIWIKAYSVKDVEDVLDEIDRQCQ